MANLLLFKDGVTDRDPSMKNTDRSALYAIVQAAVNVELFTIPLYMTSLYSLYGMHQITGQNDFYQGRLWPGMATTADPRTDNDLAFNAIFSVFIAEMLHLQLASNICKAVGVSPDYTSAALQNDKYGWTCYGPTNTVIPHIIDFKDTIAPYNEIKVKLDAVNKEQISLFLAIEQTEENAEEIIDKNKRTKYFPEVPFADWKPSYDETNLPMFGSIGHMYECLWNYLSIQYSDKTSLWEDVYAHLQQDLFNVKSSGHPLPEYPEMSATITDDKGDKQLSQLKDMINGITDQGEGKGVIARINARLGLLQAVKPNFQPSEEALKKDYPAYTDTGAPAPSRDAKARSMYGAMDHYETFQKVMDLLDKGNIRTWDQWHAEGNTWNADMLKTADYDKNKYKQLPGADDIAGALNRLKQNDPEANYTLLSHAAAGAIAGVTTVLNTYWNNKGTQFPFPSMAGSGDRMSICWAIFGKAPDLSLGLEKRKPGVLYHACQGMNLDPANPDSGNTCAAIEVYHTCKGSNSCKAEGGCGFVQSVDGGSNCGTKVAMLASTKKEAYSNANTSKVEGRCSPSWVSAPSDNKCGALGGCAVLISASQMYPAPEPMTGMELFDFGPGPDFKSESIGKMPYEAGELVYDVAWKAYCQVLEHRQQPAPGNPLPPSDIRLAFPPST